MTAKEFNITTLYKPGDEVFNKGDTYIFAPARNQPQQIKGVFPHEELGLKKGWKLKSDMNKEKPTLKDLKQFFRDNWNSLPDMSSVFKECGHTSAKEFVKDHILTLENNPGNPDYLPYYERLRSYYQYIKETKS